MTILIEMVTVLLFISGFISTALAFLEYVRFRQDKCVLADSQMVTGQLREQRQVVKAGTAARKSTSTRPMERTTMPGKKSDEFAPGQVILNRFSLQRLLGRGGMGIVWLAEDMTLEMEVALKFVPPVLAHDPQAIRRLRAEAHRNRALNHPHIIDVHDFIETAEMAFIVMEYVDGGTLSMLCQSRPQGIFEADDIAQWVRQLCDALAYAHAMELLHLDIKPANLIVTKAGQLKVADFGVSEIIDDLATRATGTGIRAGTLTYMSPQQLQGKRPCVADDIYSVGATVYHLLTSKPPFFGKHEPVYYQVTHMMPPSMAERRQQLGISGKIIPKEWEQTIAVCLAKAPAKRPLSVNEIAQRLGLPGLTRAAKQQIVPHEHEEKRAVVPASLAELSESSATMARRFARRCVVLRGISQTGSSRALIPSAGQAHDTLSDGDVVMSSDLTKRGCLLVANIQMSAVLSGGASLSQLGKLVGAWLQSCMVIIEREKGCVNRFLGDGFLVYWEDGTAKSSQVFSALADLQNIQLMFKLDFRVALHHGEFKARRAQSHPHSVRSEKLREELFGNAVDIVFRMEKLAMSLDVPMIFSETAVNYLGLVKRTKSLGKHSLKELSEPLPFFAPSDYILPQKRHRTFGFGRVTTAS